ncbi:MAG TPA: glutaredoxin domain-containing protein [Solirubrobacteraceae bacterium]|jgi:glutaredoxin 3|nr:glutaredoxin domain-containing protein [Solirubrobacteraceae bacterium]
MSDVIVYTTERCSYCVRVKMLLKSRDIDFEEVNVAGDPEAFVELAQKTGMMTLPQVLVGGILVGGYQETAAAVQNGMLADLLAP